jgi:hypothetical protein
MRVWLDDRRPPPDGEWAWVKTPEEAIELLATGEVSEISLDHDLGLLDREPGPPELSQVRVAFPAKGDMWGEG